MFLHIFLFRWKPAATEALKARALADILAFQGQTPGLLEVHAGVNVSPRSNGHEFGGVMKFTDRAAFEAYAVSPIHMQLLEWLIPLVEATEVDFKI
jgi:hypothetical protein